MFFSTLRRSLLGRTLAAVVTVSALLMILTAAALFWWAREDALAMQDAHLEDMTAALARADVAALVPRALTMDPKQFAERIESDQPLPMRHHRMMMRGMMNRMGMAPDRNAGERRTAIPAGESVLVRLITRQGQAVSTTLEKALPAGLSTLEIDGEHNRVCLVFLPNGRYTAPAEPMAMREATVLEQAKTAVMPLLVLLPLLLFAISAVLWRALRPLKRAAADVKGRSATDLAPLSYAGVPLEIAPFVEAVNDLLARVQAARTREIRFTADAAHELRSPLTSLTIEAEHLKRLNLSEEARPIVENLESGLARSVHQVSQLLLFARAQAGESAAVLARDAKPWYLSELVGDVVEPILPAIAEKSIRFEVEGLDTDTPEAPVKGVSRAAIQAMVRNLVENAVHYTPARGAVTVRVERSARDLSIVVSDTGPGIPESERERVFDPFYRIAGSGLPGTGLGLAIVRTYAETVGARIELADARPGEVPPGLKASVRLALPAASDADETDKATEDA